MEENKLWPLEYQEAMLEHQTTLQCLDVAMQGSSPRGWTLEQAKEARRILAQAGQVYTATCERVAALQPAVRRRLSAEAKQQLEKFDELQRTMVEVT